MIKKKRSVLHLLAIIFAFITIAVNGFVIIALLSNLAGVRDIYAKVVQEMSSYVIDIDAEVDFTCFELGLAIFVHLIFAIRLIRLYRFATPGMELGKALTNISVWYLILSFSVASLLTLIAGIVMTSKVNKPVIAAAVPKEHTAVGEINEYKMKAMTEAVNRLKELRQSGAITEDEYYANLDKILEG